MARSFNGTSNYLQSASTLSLSSASRIAISFWRYINSGGQPDTMTLEYGPDAFATEDGTFALYNDGSSGLPLIQLNAPTHDHQGSVSVAPSTTTWHHWLINLDMTLSGGNLEIQSVYIDGVLQTLTNTDGSDFSNTGAVFANETLNVMGRNGASLFQGGRLADLCIWAPTSVLSSTDASTLAGGARANTVRTSEIAYYWPLLGTTSPEPAAIGSTALTVTGATSVADPPTLASFLPPLSFTVTKTDSTHTSVSWTSSDSTITHGVSIVRAAGDKTTSVDGNGVAVGASGYDPTTIAGATTIASAVTTSPYADTVPTSGTYTYWINRTS